jgi:phosphatidylglycerol:prolipoprotein diacylglycerol transferase
MDWLDPVALQIGPIAIRWYALAYIAGFVLGWRYALWLTRRSPLPPDPQALDEFLTWAVVGTILGGRLGYVLFYNLEEYLADPLTIFYVWRGGMSFHGGLAGVILATVLFARRRGFPIMALGDVVAAAAPIGLFFGRIANFVNGELYGRPSDVPWAITFPTPPDVPMVPRHPSQLYEAGLEGIVLFLILLPMALNPRIRARMGTITGVFLTGYGLARFLVEFVREPDTQLGFLWLGATMGQLLSLPMIVIGILFLIFSRRPETARTA